MADKKSFIVHFSTYESIKDFDDAQLGKIFRAMCEYAITGKEITLTKMLKVAFRFVKSQMDADIKKYKETCEKRSDAGRSSAQKRAESKSTNVNKCQQNEQMPTKATDIDVDIDVDVDVDNIDIINMTRQDKTRQRVRADNFAEEDCYYVNTLCAIIDEVDSMNDSETIIIDGNQVKAEFVKGVFNKIDFFVFEYAVNKCKSNPNIVVKTKPYLRTLLYNAYFEMYPKIQEEVKKIFPLRRASNEL